MACTSEHVELFVSGRLCLLGEHSDWSAEHGLHRGHCLVVGTDQGMSATARPGNEFVVESLVPGRHERENHWRRRMSCASTRETLWEAAHDQDEFFRYCAGVAFYVLKRYGIGGIDLKVTAMDLPLRKGVSSSAAICILMAKAFNAVYGLDLFPHELMELAYLGEKLTGSQCGRMDQACIYGKTPVLLTFAKGQRVQIEPMFPRRTIHMLFVDLDGEKDTVRILQDLQGSYDRSGPLQKALGEVNERHVRSGFQAIQEGDAKELGRLMTAVQADFDRLVAPHCPQELSSPILHELLSRPFVHPHVYGGKGVGSQGDGVAQFVARSARDRSELMRKIEMYRPGMRCFELTIVPVQALQEQRFARRELAHSMSPPPALVSEGTDEPAA